MTYLVTDACINYKYQDCIDCAVFEPECPVDAIKPDTIPDAAKWIEINQRLADNWPNISAKGAVPADADDWAKNTDKLPLPSEARASQS